ncbi:predicted protein [Lichtheimia corymbifera JMRC:FSU:9682]|uniref:Uncharacterized protein n=1 Tax=Lichtheimia corymbifera JMRC:FSU:9682 TaxID=1263082 RepID=A0A068RSW8_9FUNG|nr:predicted protein [Lichtheimia corymbifera JMRC:FSU:9682]
MKFSTTAVLTVVACVAMCDHLVAAKPMPAPTGDDSTKCQSLDDPRSKYLCNNYCKDNGIGDSHVVQCGKHKGICKCDGYKPIQPEPGKK